MLLLEVNDLRVHYGSAEVLKGNSINLEKGEVVAPMVRGRRPH
jgi:ABC-type histidine transport system ATPase subunit